MTRKRDRFFAGFGAALFLVSASVVTVVAIANNIGDHKKSTDTSTTSPTQTTAQQAAANCPETSVAAATATLPAVYKPTASVTDTQTTILADASGAPIKKDQCLQVKYYGTLATKGTVFDENFDKATAFQFLLGESQVIPGWDKGLVGVRVGSTVRLVIPAAQAYGSQAQNGIPANSDLVFVVQVLSAK